MSPPSHTVVVPIPLALLLHPIASEFPYAPWLTDAQASSGGIRLPLDSEGFRNCFEYARAVIRSAASDSTARAEARRFAGEIYGINLKHYGIVPPAGYRAFTKAGEASASSSSVIPRKRPLEAAESSRRQTSHMPRRSIDDIGLGRPSAAVDVFSSTAIAGPSSSRGSRVDAAALGLEDELEKEEEVERGRERRVRIVTPPSQRGVAAMQLAKTTNMRGQWRDGIPLVPVPNWHGQPPDSDLPPLPTLSSLHALSDIDLGAWLRFYDGDDADVPMTRFAREIALCSRLGVLWSPSAPNNTPLPPLSSPRSPTPTSPLRPRGGPLHIHIQQDEDHEPPSGPASAPPSCASASPPSMSIDMSRAITAPAIRITPPTPTGSPSMDSPSTEPPATPPHRYPRPSSFSYSYTQTHPISHAYTHRYRRHSVPPPSVRHDSMDVDDHPATSPPFHLTRGPRRSSPPTTSSAAAPGPSGPTGQPIAGYKMVMRHGVPYAVRWTSSS